MNFHISHIRHNYFYSYIVKTGYKNKSNIGELLKMDFN